MIHYPYLKEQPSSHQMIDTFKGYNHNLRIGKGEFYEMENLTSDDYPLLSVRRRRGYIGNIEAPGYATGMLYVSGVGLFAAVNTQTPQDSADPEEGELYLLDESGKAKAVAHHLMAGPKSLALMGKNLFICPDMVCTDLDAIQTKDHPDFWSMSYSLAVTGGVIFANPCREDGSEYENYVPSETSPSSPEDMMVWVDTSVYPYVVRQYSSIQEEWVTLSNTYIRIWSTGNSLMEHRFNAGDGITISGLKGDAEFLNGSHIVRNTGHGYIVVAGTMQRKISYSPVIPAIFERKVPVLDFVVESGNRLWGCAKNTNEIYACKLGDYRNWNCFQGLSTDSWVGTIGTPGEFTGAVVQNSYPIFYKENCKHKVWPSSSGAHQITTVPCDGVEKGSENSIAVLDGTVFYKSGSGVFADDGGGTVEIGQALGDARYCNAIGAIYDRKYYLSMENSTGNRELFVYDIVKRLWHRENYIEGTLCSAGNSLYCVEGGQMYDLTGNTGTPEEAVSWMAVTGDLGLELPEQKYISRLTLRLCLEPGATLEIYAQYDREQVWVKLGQVYGKDLHSFSLPVRPRRCDQLRLKLQGKGMCKLYSITETLAKGSELP
ncbi:MAG: hypothetical protein IIV13_00750 [Bacteroidaceae bacterium]|nr:hypothetical protein [Bacteroidaceae bacterium]